MVVRRRVNLNKKARQMKLSRAHSERGIYVLLLVGAVITIVGMIASLSKISDLRSLSNVFTTDVSSGVTSAAVIDSSHFLGESCTQVSSGNSSVEKGGKKDGSQCK